MFLFCLFVLSAMFWFGCFDLLSPTLTIFAHCFLYVRNAKLPNKYILFFFFSLALTRILFFCLFFVCCDNEYISCVFCVIYHLMFVLFSF